MAFGWHACFAAAVVLGALSLPTAPPTDCSVAFSCMSPLESLALVAILDGAPIFAGLLIVTVVAAGMFARWTRSPTFAGTFAAFLSLCLVTASVAAYVGAA